MEPGKANTGITTSVNVTQGARVQFSGSAKNPGGVQQFSINVTQAGETLYHVTTTGAPDGSGQVPDVLSLLGTNGSGAPGSQPMVVNLSTPVILVATATNFHAMSQSITVTYNPVSSNIGVGGGPGTGQSPPPTAGQLFLSATHDLGPFQSTTAPPGFCQAMLTWSVTPNSLTETTGVSTAYTNTVTATPTPAWLYDAPSGLYTARCPYGQWWATCERGTWTSATGAGG